MPKTKKILVPGHYPYLITREVEVGPGIQPRDFRFMFQVYWLVSGSRGRHWCQATGRKCAQTVYRNIPWSGTEKFSLYVSPIARQELHYSAVFWTKEAHQTSQPWRLLRGELIPAPDAYSDIVPEGYYN